MDREDKILEYIEANFGCTKTSVKNSMKDIGEGTTDKILKKLIDEDKKVICIIDVNPRIHHLFINDKNKFAMINLLLSKVKEQMEKQKRIRVQLTNGVTLSFPLNGVVPISKAATMETVENLIATTEDFKPFLTK